MKHSTRATPKPRSSTKFFETLESRQMYSAAVYAQPDSSYTPTQPAITVVDSKNKKNKPPTTDPAPPAPAAGADAPK